MKLNEIDNSLRRQKQVIDKLFVEYTTGRSAEIRNQLQARIKEIFPTGVSGIDLSLDEYLNLIYDDTIKVLTGL